MKHLFALMVLLCSFSSWALSGRAAWKQSSLEDKAKLIEHYRLFFQELSAKEATSYSEWMVKRTSFFSYFVSDAWASGNMDCVYAGWPSKRVNGLCSSPARQNPDYQNGSCASNEMQCQPMFFGKGLCVPTSTKSQRNLAFSNCYKKFQGKGRTNLDVIKEIQNEGKEAELLELLDFADNVCTAGKQASTGMCKKLKGTVEELKLVLPIKEKLEERPEDNPIAIDDSLKDAIQLTIEGLKATTSVGQGEDCPPEIEVTTVIPETTSIPERSIATSASTYTPQEAMADINSGELTFMGRHKFPVSDSNYTCVFKSAKAYILYNNCMAKRNEAQATDIEVISFDGGMLSFYVENGSSNNGPISEMDRSQYDGSWKFYYTPSSPAHNLNISQLKDYRGDLTSYKDGACWIGTQGNAQDMSSNKVQCYGNASAHLQEWAPHADRFWRNPGPEWHQAKRNLRHLVKTVPF